MQKTQSKAKVSVSDQLMKIGTVLAGAVTGFAAPSFLKGLYTPGTPTPMTNALPALVVTVAGAAGYVYAENPTAKLFALGATAGAGVRSVQAFADGKISQLQGLLPIGNVDMSDFQLEEGYAYDLEDSMGEEVQDNPFLLQRYVPENQVNGVDSSWAAVAGVDPSWLGGDFEENAFSDKF